MSTLFTSTLLFDVAPETVQSLGWGPLVLLFVIAFVFAVSIMAVLVSVLIRMKRRNVALIQQAEPTPAIQNFTSAE